MAAPVTTRGLSRADQDQIRDAIASGRRPKVVFTDAAGQIAGQTGQVVGLIDPESSEEWITVRFGKDELPFSPADLAMPVRGTAGRAVAAKPTRRAGTTAAAPSRAAATPAVKPTVPPASRVANGAKSKAEPEFLLDKPTVAAFRAQAQPAPAPPMRTIGDDEPPAPEPRPVKAAKAKPQASLVVTLSYADREWTLAATQGSKSLAKPYPVSPADALRMVALVDVPSVHGAVQSIIAAERAEAEIRAVRLRAELADLEARLAELAQHP